LKINLSPFFIDDDKCNRRKWNIAQDVNISSQFEIPLRIKVISWWPITVAQIGKLAYEIYKHHGLEVVQNWANIQAGYYLAIDPTTWCLGSSEMGGGQ